MMATSFRGEIVKSRVRWHDKQAIQKFIEGMEGKWVLITIEEYSKKRSLNVNAYFHGVVCKCLSEATGYEPFEIKELLKAMFLYTVDRRGRVHVRGTSTLTKRQMSEFIEKCCRWAAVYLDCYIPPPESCPEAWAA